MSFDPEVHIKFYTTLNDFCIQAVTGAYLAVYRTLPEDATCSHKMNALINHPDFMMPIIQQYINDCWKSYHLKVDPFVMTSINTILDLGLITHPSCVFKLIADTCTEMVTFLVSASQTHSFEYNNLPILREMIRRILFTKAHQHMQEQLKDKNTIQCDHTCLVYEYKDGDNFLIGL